MVKEEIVITIIITIMNNNNHQPQKKICQNCGKEFLIEPEDLEFYEKIGVPAPTWCPDCRLQRRLSFRNERALYKRKCDLCGRDIISMYPSDIPFPVYCQKCYWSDKWDPMDYGRDYDWNKPFFKQFKELMNKTPRLSLLVYESVNSEYTNFAGRNKNCYLIVSSGEAENSMYGYRYMKTKDVVDSEDVRNSELCYECFQCSHVYKAVFCSKCENSHDIYLSYNCHGCSHCFGCVNLRNKSYYIFNQPYSKEEYTQKINFILGSYTKFKEANIKFQALLKKSIFRFAQIIHSVDCRGDNISDSKNCIQSFNVASSKNLKYVSFAVNAFDSYDSGFIDYSEMCYESLSGDKDARKYFTYGCWGSYDLYYSDTCSSSHHLFGCIGLRHKSYSVLNKQYTKEEYEELVSKIIEQMKKLPYTDQKGREYRYGEFFPPELSPFAYNETVVQEYFPLTKEEALNQGYQWKESEEKNLKPDIYTQDLPDHIKDVSDDIVAKTIQCAHAQVKEDGALEPGCNEQCTTAFRITKEELDFYRRMNLPLPRLCPNCRHYQRIKQRNPLKLYQRQCMCGGKTSTNGVYKNTSQHFHKEEPCPNTFYTTYAPDRPEIVYCEECYKKEIG